MFYHKFFHLSLSPWPLFLSIFSFNFFISSLLLFLKKKLIFMVFSIISLSIFMFLWWRDVIYESMMGFYSFELKNNLKLGMLLFIFSEVMFFFGWFWAFFHNSLTPSNEIGSMWPPFSIISMEPFQMPFLNTCILLTSGLTITWAHHMLLSNNLSTNYFVYTIFFGYLFTCIQGFEYYNCLFCVSDNSFGSSFFITTGFHGLHVLIGSLYIFYCLFLVLTKNMNKWNNLSIDFSIWYWHFVDVVWLFLFFFIYWWSF